MNGFECMLIKYPQRTHGQETVKTLQQKASWSRVGLGLKWQVQNISTLSKWKWLRIFTSREKWASKWKQSQVACTVDSALAKTWNVHLRKILCFGRMNRSGLLFRCRVSRPQIRRKKSLIWRQKGEGLSFLLGDTNYGSKDLADAQGL